MLPEYTSRRVLIVDDEPVVADTIRRMVLSRFGCHVVTAGDGSEAIALLSKEPFDLILTDMLMPGLHGVELILEMRKAAPQCAVMVMTAHPSEFPYVDVIQAGAADFMTKPYQSLELEAKIVRIFKEIDLHAELMRDKERMLRDMEEMKKARAAQALAERKYHSLFELSMNGMALTTTKGYDVVEANGAFCDLCGRSKEEILGRSLLSLIHPSEHDRFRQGLDILSSIGCGTLNNMILERASGGQLYFDISITFISVAEESLVLFALKDVTAQTELQMELADIAQKDGLTGLLNKRTFHRHLESAIVRARRQNQPMALMMIDLDNFKQCNDNFGHPAGDRLLTRVGELIRKQVRGASDESFRYGGDEFAILLVDVAPEIAAKIAERVRSTFEAGECYGTTMSIGLVAYDTGMDVDAFVLAADQALYRAKALGKNTVHVA